MEKSSPYFYLLFALLFWGSAPSIAKLALKRIDIFQITFFMYLFSSLSLLFIIFLLKKHTYINKLKKRDFIHFIYMSFIGIFFYFLFLFSSLSYATIQDAVIINYTWPIWMVIFSIYFLGEKFQLKNLLSIMVGFTGLFFILTRGNFSDLSLINSPGFGFALLSAVFYGLFSAMGKSSRRDPVVSMFFYYFFSLIYSFIGFIFFSNIIVFNLEDLAAVSWLGICSCGLGFLFWFEALRQGESYELANFVYLTPFVSLIFIYFFIGEKIQISSLLGLFFIILAIFVNKIEIYHPSTTKES